MTASVLPHPSRPPFSTANPHALAVILQASQTKSIIAAQDIFDLSGTKLWARDRPLSSALQCLLGARQLRNPLESCLMAENGVTNAALAQALEELLASPLPLASLLRPRAAKLLQQVPHLPLHGVAQLLLTVGQVSRPQTFAHSVQAMALAGALMISHGGGTADLRQAMLAGLLHDLGEMYIGPQHDEADADRTLDFQSQQQLVVHPHIGYLLLTQLTDYPQRVSRAVAEHHERLDGTGYPHALQRDAVSPLGRMLAVSEAVLNALRQPGADLARASVALRVVSGEYDLSWVGRIADEVRARRGPAAGPAAPAADAAGVQQSLARLDAAIQCTQCSVEAMAGSAETPSLRAGFALAQHLLGRLRTGWYASGLWSTDSLSGQDAAEGQAVTAELGSRLRAIERATQLRAGELPPADAQRLAQFSSTLQAAMQ